MQFQRKLSASVIAICKLDRTSNFCSGVVAMLHIAPIAASWPEHGTSVA